MLPLFMTLQGGGGTVIGPTLVTNEDGTGGGIRIMNTRSMFLQESRGRKRFSTVLANQPKTWRGRKKETTQTNYSNTE